MNSNDQGNGRFELNQHAWINMDWGGAPWSWCGGKIVAMTRGEDFRNTTGILAGPPAMVGKAERFAMVYTIDLDGTNTRVAVCNYRMATDAEFAALQAGTVEDGRIWEPARSPRLRFGDHVRLTIGADIWAWGYEMLEGDPTISPMLYLGKGRVYHGLATQIYCDSFVLYCETDYGTCDVWCILDHPAYKIEVLSPDEARHERTDRMKR